MTRTTATRIAWRSWRLLVVAAAGAAQLVVGPALAAPGANEKTVERRFDIQEYRVVGNTVLPEEGIDEAVYPFLGPDRTIGDVEKARAALEAVYDKLGYATVSVQIPVQHVTDGVVVIQVVERPVGRLRVHDSRYYDIDRIKRDVPSLAEGNVPRMPDVQREIVALNQWPDRTITPALRAGKAPGTVDVDLQVQDRFPGHASIELNNQRSQDTAALRLSGTLTYNNLWQRGDSASASFQLAPQNPSNAKVISGSYLFRIPGSSMSLLASYLHSDSNVSTLGTTTVVGKGDVAGLRLITPLGYDTGFVHSLSVGVDYKRFDDTTTIAGAVTEVPITYYPISASYQANWSDEQSQTDLQVTPTVALNGLGSNLADFQLARARAVAGFAYLRTEVSRTQTLPHDIQLYARLYGQVSPNALISNEQFPLGGIDSVRGYLEGEALGDNGVALQTELRGPSLAPFIGAPLNELRPLVFVDAGKATIHSPLPEQTSTFGLASSGIGVRVRLLDSLGGEVLGATTLTDGPSTKAHDERLLFRINGDF